MMRPKQMYIRLSLVLLATLSTTSLAQSGGAVGDSLQLTARQDSVQQGRNWLSGLLRRIARRSDDNSAIQANSIATADSAMGSDSTEMTPVVVAEVRSFTSRKDSLAWLSARRVATRAGGFHINVDIFAHQLYVIAANGDTLRQAPVATASNGTVKFGDRHWTFTTPRGLRRVLAKEKDPVWRPPDWHFAEVALEHGLKLKYLERGHPVHLQDGTILKVVGDEVGIVAPGTTEFQPLVLDMHVVFDNILFIPPVDTKQREVPGELGHFRLTLGDGYMLHGTPFANSIGASVTHGCVRLHDDDIEWLFDNTPVGTKVYLY